MVHPRPPSDASYGSSVGHRRAVRQVNLQRELKWLREGGRLPVESLRLVGRLPGNATSAEGCDHRC